MMFAKRMFYLTSCKVKKSFFSGVHISTSPTFKEQKIKIKNYEINYLRVGRGPHHVFCAAGMFGTIQSDFRKQIEGFDRDKFSLVIWDPPGFGKSIALDNKETLETFPRDADLAYELMKALQIPKYSVLGWSYGGTASLLLASRYPDMINKLVVWGCTTSILSHELTYFTNLRNLNNWPKVTRETMIKRYGRENFIKKIDKTVEVFETIYYSKNFYCGEVERIKCPTFILHGAKDSVIDSMYHHKHLRGLIKNSRTHLYPDGEHDIHMKYADDFNKRVQEFLLE